MKYFTGQRIEQAIWWVFLASLGLQARIIIWQADAQFVQWRSASLYATDILFFFLLVFALVRLFRNWKRNTKNRKLSSWDWALLVFLGAALLSVFHASHSGVAWISLVRLLQGLLVYAYVRWYAMERFAGDAALLAFVLGVLAQSVLGLAQFILQRDVGLRFAGETLLRPSMRGVAVFYDLANEKTLRAYGTLPHPNVLALFVSLALVVVVYLYVRHSDATVRRERFVWFGVAGVLVWGLAATFSRTVVAALIAASAIPFVVLFSVRSRLWPNTERLQRRVRDIVIVLLLAAVAFSVLFWPQVLARAGISPQEEAVELRVFYAVQALSSGDGLFGINWTGNGIGNFVTWLQDANPYVPVWQYQPAHNLYLLVYTETGLFGAGALVLFLVLLLRSFLGASRMEPLIRWSLVAVAAMLLFIALFDHFFWTLQQGRLVWWLFWGVVARLADAPVKQAGHLTYTYR